MIGAELKSTAFRVGLSGSKNKSQPVNQMKQVPLQREKGYLAYNGRKNFIFY